MNESKAARYQRLRRRGHSASVLSTAAMLAVVALTPAAGWIAGLSERVVRAWPAPLAASGALVGVVVLVAVACEVASLPALIYLAVKVERAYGQPRATVEDVIAAELQGTLLVLPLIVGAAAIAAGAAALVGAWWWTLAGAGMAVAAAVAVRVGPVVFARVAGVRPLARRELAAQLEALAATSGVPLRGIDEWAAPDPARASAMVLGAGRERRVVLSAEIARTWADDEITVVVAHELAHHVYRDVWWTLALDAALWTCACGAADLMLRVAGLPIGGASGAVFLARLPALALVAGLVWLAATPIRHGQSRRQERRADRFALESTGHVEAFGTAIRRLSARHLVEDRPSLVTRWLYHRHPPIADRLALAETYRRSMTRQPASDADSLVAR
ncbi:MAG TPA: M48 family metalloprotease [Vicinamibacterales bacterium]|jgi:STE24 endopeptidase|nr:M48 family metalloprotease [Vicinamibacterales bacterium]